MRTRDGLDRVREAAKKLADAERRVVVERRRRDREITRIMHAPPGGRSPYTREQVGVAADLSPHAIDKITRKVAA